MCSPDVLPVMCPAIQSACAQFPRAAEAIMAHHGMDLAEYDTLRTRAERDLFFNQRVRGNIQRLDHEAVQAAKPVETVNTRAGADS